jgi:hypothetical protein
MVKTQQPLNLKENDYIALSFGSFNISFHRFEKGYSLRILPQVSPATHCIY